MSQPYDYERAKCEDPRTISEQFKALSNTKKKYSILDKDTYNFNETSFMIGQIQPRIVVTATERHNQLKKITAR